MWRWQRRWRLTQRLLVTIRKSSKTNLSLVQVCGSPHWQHTQLDGTCWKSPNSNSTVTSCADSGLWTGAKVCSALKVSSDMVLQPGAVIAAFYSTWMCSQGLVGTAMKTMGVRNPPSLPMLHERSVTGLEQKTVSEQTLILHQEVQLQPSHGDSEPEPGSKPLLEPFLANIHWTAELPTITDMVQNSTDCNTVYLSVYTHTPPMYALPQTQSMSVMFDAALLFV